MKCNYEAKLGLLKHVAASLRGVIEEQAGAMQGMGKLAEAKATAALAIQLIAVDLLVDAVTSIHSELAHDAPGTSAEQSEHTNGLINAVNDAVGEYFGTVPPPRTPQNYN